MSFLNDIFRKLFIIFISMINYIKNIHLFFSKMLNDSTKNGEVSSKRFVGIFGFLVICAALIINLIFKVEPSSVLVEALMYIVIGALFGTSLDKIMTPRQSNSTPQDKNEPKI